MQKCCETLLCQSLGLDVTGWVMYALLAKWPIGIMKMSVGTNNAGFDS